MWAILRSICLLVLLVPAACTVYDPFTDNNAQGYNGYNGSYNSGSSFQQYDYNASIGRCQMSDGSVHWTSGSGQCAAADQQRQQERYQQLPQSNYRQQEYRPQYEPPASGRGMIWDEYGKNWHYVP